MTFRTWIALAETVVPRAFEERDTMTKQVFSWILVSGLAVVSAEVNAANSRAIVGGDRAITGGDSRAIVGGDSRKATLRLSGPAEFVDTEAGTVVALGQVFKVRPHSPIANQLKQQIGLGATPTVVATSQRGTRSVRLSYGGDSYVAGASSVLISGKVTSVNSTIGQLKIGNTVVDFTPLLVTQPGLTVKVGENVRVSGIQPVSRGAILASELAQ